MIVSTTIQEVREAVSSARENGPTIGLVPTMGALHEGHLSLIRAAKNETHFVVVSIFVNPTQFGPSEDLAEYPRPIEQDMTHCHAEGVDLVFHPSADEVYSTSACTTVTVNGLQEKLCGKSRPTHFQGVTTVVLKLLNIVQPDVAFFGQKDAQQARIIRQMVDDLNVKVKLRVCPIVREPDGLAISSRNQYLNEKQRKSALVLNQSLNAVQAGFDSGEGDAGTLRQIVMDMVARTAGAELDYVEIVDNDTLELIEIIDRPALAAIAVRFGETRLIDNVVLNG